MFAGKDKKQGRGRTNSLNITFGHVLIEILTVPFNLWCFDLDHHFHLFLELTVLVTSQWFFYLFISVVVPHRWAIVQQHRNQDSNWSREVWGTCHKYYATSIWVSQACSVSSPHFLRMLAISSIPLDIVFISESP